MIITIIIIIIIIKDHDDRKSLYSIIGRSIKFIRELGMRRTAAMPAEQRPRPNTRVANSSGPSGNQKRSKLNTHNG